MHNLRNLTDHDVVLVGPEGSQCTIAREAGGYPARVGLNRDELGVLPTDHGGIRVVRSTPGETMDLPPERPGTWLVVSRIVAVANPDRDDLLVPGGHIRDHRGQVCAARWLERVR